MHADLIELRAFTTALQSIGMVTMLVLVEAVCGVVQILACIAGVSHAWGYGFSGAAIIAVAIAFTPWVGWVVMSPMAFYGASAAWDLPWWQALLLVAPSIALSVFAPAGKSQWRGWRFSRYGG